MFVQDYNKNECFHRYAVIGGKDREREIDRERGRE